MRVVDSVPVSFVLIFALGSHVLDFLYCLPGVKLSGFDLGDDFYHHFG